MVALVGIELYHVLGQQEPVAEMVSCPELTQGCRWTQGGAPLVLVATAPPSPLRPFDLRLEGRTVRSASARFEMSGMEMGPNRYALIQTASGHWTAKVILPVCVTGRHDWKLFLTVNGQTFVIPFVTE